MYKIKYTENGVVSYDKNEYETEMEAYFQASKVVAEHHDRDFGFLPREHRPATHILFPLKVEYRGIGEKSTDAISFCADIIERKDGLRAGTHQNMSLAEILQFCSEGDGLTLMKHSKPELAMRSDTWMPFTHEGAKAYCHLVDLIYSIGRETLSAGEAETLVESLDQAYADEVPICEELTRDYFEDIDHVETEKELMDVLHDANEQTDLPEDERCAVWQYGKEVLFEKFGVRL